MSSSPGLDIAASAFGDLPLSDWRFFDADPPEVDPAIFTDSQTVSAALLAKHNHLQPSGSSSREPRFKRIQPHPYGGVDRRRELMDRVVADRKSWAETIVALTHCLHRLQKLTQVLERISLLFFKTCSRLIIWLVLRTLP